MIEHYSMLSAITEWPSTRMSMAMGTNAGALHDLAAHKSSAGDTADLKGVVDRAVACRNNHGVFGAEAVLGG